MGSSSTINLPDMCQQSLTFGTTKLPYDIAAKVFDYLQSHDLYRSTLVCKNWRYAITPLLWRSPRFYHKLDRQLSDKYSAPISTMWSVTSGSRENAYIIYQTLDVAEYRHGYGSQLSFRNLPLGQFVRSLSFEYREQLVTDQTLADIAEHCPSLQFLSLSGCRSITDNGLRYLMRGKLRHSLRSIYLSECNRITDYGLALVSKLCVRLHTISLNGCIRITNAGIIVLVKSSAIPRWPDSFKSKLQDISYRRSTNLSGSTIQYLARTCGPSLRKLDLASSGNIGDAEIKAISDHCINLQHLNVAKKKKMQIVIGNDVESLPNIMPSAQPSSSGAGGADPKTDTKNEITDETIEYMIKKLDLIHLDLSNVLTISNQSVIHISHHCKSLASIVLIGCNNINGDSLPYLLALHRRFDNLVDISFGESDVNFNDTVNSIEKADDWKDWIHQKLVPDVR
ncbi:hypothetical protein INT43_003211 [Umbelopsis isabellina]|uniref:F-box domain-containing protein n=1 Tax=Mortierella isabellina TaxID=91625 RepID=A0A8H7PR40_MORIS|nr:hypothetical protein INT43_003211 [Umbelopsis isabellina]